MNKIPTIYSFYIKGYMLSALVFFSLAFIAGISYLPVQALLGLSFNLEFFIWIVAVYFLTTPFLAKIMLEVGNLPPDFEYRIDLNEWFESDETKNVFIKLHNIQASPESVTLGEMQDAILQASNIIKLSKKLIEDQEIKIDNLKRLVISNEREYLNAKTTSDKAKELTNQRLELISSLLTTDAKRESRKGFIYGAITSFPIGVLSSVTAAYLMGYLNFDF